MQVWFTDDAFSRRIYSREMAPCPDDPSRLQSLGVDGATYLLGRDCYPTRREAAARAVIMVRARIDQLEAVAAELHGEAVDEAA